MLPANRSNNRLKHSSKRTPSLGLKDLGLSLAEIVMVGDDYATDVRGVNGAGIRAVWYNPSGDEKRTGHMHRTIHDLASLPELLERWRQ